MKLENLYKKIKGFTLIELLIVIAIIGIIAAIAAPIYLGQRERSKIKTVEASAKGAVSEIQYILDAYIHGDPFIALSGSPPGIKTCFEAKNVVPTSSCSAMYPQITTVSNYSHGNINGLIDIIIEHHSAKGEISPFSPTLSLFTKTKSGDGQIVLLSVGQNSIQIKGYGVGNETIFNTTVFSH